MLLYVRTVILVVRMIRLIRPDERVFAISYVALRPDDKPCSVKLHSPRAVAFSSASFGSFCRVVYLFCAFYA